MTVEDRLEFKMFLTNWINILGKKKKVSSIETAQKEEVFSHRNMNNGLGDLEGNKSNQSLNFITK